MPRMPRLQGRVPGRRRHGAVQERVPRRLLAAPRHAAARARRRARARRCREWGSRFAPLVERGRRQARIGRWINERLLGIDRRRTPPACARTTFARASPAARRIARSAHRPSAASAAWSSSTTPSRTTIIPEIGMAAADVLDAAGVGVRLAPHGCCGRPLISQGLLDEARALAQRNATRSIDTAARGRAHPVPRAELPVGGARGCAGAAARRGAAQGAGGRRRVRAVRGLLEQRAARRAVALPLQAGTADGPAARPLSSEGDGTAGAGRRCSSRIPGATVVDLDAGCCGMAARSATRSEHYDVSRQIGEREAAAGGARAEARRGAGGAGHVVPPQVQHFAGVRGECTRRNYCEPF